MEAAPAQVEHFFGAPARRAHDEDVAEPLFVVPVRARQGGERRGRGPRVSKYGVNAYLLEFDPKTEKMQMVMDVHEVIGSPSTGFAAQAKIHTRNNVGASGKIYVGSKQGYPEKGE